jgi:hypothetical protein
MIKSKGEAIAGFRRDIERWQQELSALEANGLGKSDAADTIREWIKALSDIIRGLV